MRAVRALIAVALVVAVMCGSAQAAKSPLVQLRWHEVARGVTTVTATDRYLAYSTANGLMLIDQRTHAKHQLAASDCGQFPVGLFFGGPWMAGCSDPHAQSPYTRLYNIAGRYWVTVPTPASCGPDCSATAVGAQWIKLQSLNPDCIEHCGAPGELLQNIRTGEAERDPAAPGGRLRENLDSASGASPLCPPLRYPAYYYSDTEQVAPGMLTMLGQFALSLGFVKRIEQCHSSWQRRIWAQDIIADSRLVLWNDGWWRTSPKHDPNHGVLLPSHREFTFYIPRRFQRGEASVEIAISGRTIYLVTAGHALWAATAPSLG